MELARSREIHHPKLLMDNYYSSPLLFLRLYDKEVGACGTVRAHRKFYPKDVVVKASSVERGFYDYRCSAPLLASVWKDKRIINFLTTMHDAETATPTTVPRTTVQGQEVTREEVTCPPLLPAYMRGVDRAD